MLKIISILLALFCMNVQGMLTRSMLYEVPGTLCSVGSYYCMIKGCDEWSRSCGNQQDKKRFYSYLSVAAGLKAASLVLDAPYFADIRKTELWAVKETGSLYMGMGLYLLETAKKKYGNTTLQHEANQELFGAMVVMLLGGFHLGLPMIVTDSGSCTK